MEEPDVRRAVAAAVATASALGLHASDAVVLSNSDRIVLRLLPSDVVARVAPSAHHDGFEFEVEVARRLAEAKGPVAGLDPRAEARVYTQDGFVISLWTYYEPTGPEIPPAGYAAALMRLHAALRQTSLAAPHVTERIAGAEREVADRARTPELTGPDRELLSTTLSRLSRSISRGGAAEQLLHGEPHPGNLLSTAKEPLFIDLETCVRGPVEFDVAHAPEEVAVHYPGADPALIGLCRTLTWALVATWRWCDDDQFPDRAYWRTETLNRVRSAMDGDWSHGL